MVSKYIALLWLGLALCLAGAGCEPNDSVQPENILKEPALGAEKEGKSDPAASDKTDYPPVMAEDVEYVETAHRLTGYLSQGDFEAVMAMMNSTMKQAVNTAFWDQTWSKLQQQTGNFVKIGDSVAGRMEEGGKTYVVGP